MQKNFFFLKLLLIQIWFFLFFEKNGNAETLKNGNELFLNNCMVCHLNGNNIIIPEKNLKQDSLDENGMNTINAISYQILNGKNGMPAFGGRLNESEIEAIATYVLQQAANNFHYSSH